MSTFLETLRRFGRRIIPTKLFTFAQPFYHYLLALVGALLYRFPSRHIKIVGVTGTKGKSTTVELTAAILEEVGHKTALLSTIHFKMGGEERRNLFKMTMPGRFFVQKFLREAVDAGCDWVVLEMTSEGVKQFRHTFVELNALIFTNLSPEHIESHGSFENYRDAKRALGTRLETSKKKNKAMIANASDAEGAWYLGRSVKGSYPFSLRDAEPYEEKEEGGFTFTFRNTLMELQLPGTFNLENALAAATFGISQNIAPRVIKSALAKIASVRGRVEYINVGQPFDVVVDYAHTIDSLEKFYDVFKGRRKICILGNTGGGRDSWKRPKMAALAEGVCSHIILTNEDPYDENPQKIVDEMAEGIADKTKLEIIMDRRKALRRAFELAHQKDAVLITGKGTDPYICGPNGKKESWDDATVAREELQAMVQQ